MTKLQDTMIMMAKRPIAFALSFWTMAMLMTQPAVGQAVPRNLPPEPAPELPSVSDYSLPPGDQDASGSPSPVQAEGPSEETAPPPQPIDGTATTPASGQPVPGQPATSRSPRPAPVIDQPRVEPRPGPANDPVTTSPRRPQRPSVAEPRTAPDSDSPAAADPADSDTAPSPGFSIGSPTDSRPATDQPSLADAPEAAETPSAAPPAFGNNLWLWLGGLLALLATGAGAFLVGRRKTMRDELAMIEDSMEAEPAETAPDLPPRVPESETETDFETEPVTATAAVMMPSPTPSESPESEAGDDGFVTSRLSRTPTSAVPKRSAVSRTAAPSLSLSFEPKEASSTLFNAVLAYRVTLTNTGPETVRNIRLFGRMQQADKRLADSPTPEMGEALHQIGDLDSGETVALQGEIKLPLTAIKPISFKSQSLFVPLAEFKMAYQDGQSTDHEQSALFIIGQEYEPPRPKMAPFRLDLGPRSFGPVGQRQLNAF